MEIFTLVCPVCPHCGAEKIAFQMEGQKAKQNNRGYVDHYHQLWECCNCGEPACSSSKKPMNKGGNDFKSLDCFFPVPSEITAPYGTPDNIANSFRSAKRLLRRGEDADYEAACIMARKGIEQAVNELGAEGKNLFQKINDLESKRRIPPDMRDWAQHLRDIGNDGAHEPTVTKDDAIQAVYFAEMLFTYLYSLPMRMKEYQNKS